ncbi:hypothetical protein ANO11243_079500 [Dothideomycetidae sp. 11243]|nr:hypothetical protein ANO11243_079500 [fungal sp. No.11243]
MSSTADAHTNGAAPTQETLQTAFDHTIWYLLSLWPPLALAVAEKWAGDTTSDRRDWLAGAISELFSTSPDTDADDVADMLLQVMADEFDVVVQDESEDAVALDIVAAYEAILVAGRIDVAEQARRNYEERRGRGVQIRNAGEEVQEVDSDEEVEVDGEGDEDMGDADPPALVPRREREEPEVDEDGFTKVTGRRKR